MGTEGKTIKCANCDFLIGEESSFCSHCGSFVEVKADTLAYTPPLKKVLIDRLHFLPGDLFGTRYRIVEEIGRGGMGRVYKAYDMELNLTVALKMIRQEYSANPRFIQRFKEETRLARNISHENVIRIHDLGEVEGIKFISMDFIKGHDLRELINTSGRLGVDTAIKITKQICKGLQVAHQKNIVHLDLKPRNIMIDNDGKVYIMDFGVAKSMAMQEASPEKKFVGTPPYISPERAKGEEIDQRSDIYSLGIIIFEMLTGKRPFEAKTKEGYIKKHIHQKPPSPREANPLIPRFLEKIILGCLEKDKNKRYHNSEEILRELEKHKDESMAYLPTPKMRNLRRIFYLAPVVILAAIALYLLLGNKQPKIPVNIEGGRIPLVVMYFDNDTGEESWDYQRRALCKGIIHDLLQSRFIKVLTGDTLYTILESLNLLDKNSYSSEDLKRVAVKAGAQHVLYGYFSKGEETCRINAILKNVAMDKFIDSKTLQGEGAEFFLDAPDDLTPWIRDQFNLRPQDIAADSDSDKDIEQILTGSPEAWRLYTLANQYYLQRKYQESNEALTQAIEFDEEFALAYTQMSVNYDYLGEIELTKEYARKSLTLLNKVSLRDSYLVRGWAALKLEDSYEKAIEIHKEMLEIYPDDEDGNATLGAIYRSIEEWEKALERYQIVYEVNKSYSSWNIVRFYTAMGLYAKAEEFLLDNQDNYSNQVYYHLDLAHIYLCQHHYDRALLEIEKVYSANPDMYFPTESKGNFFHLQNNFQPAELYYRQLLERDDPSSRYYGRFWLACLGLAQGKFKESENVIIEGISESEKKGRKIDIQDYSLVLAYLNLQMNLPEKAIKISAEAKSIASDAKSKKEMIFSLFLHGYAQLESGKINDAAQTAEEIKSTVIKTGVPKQIRFYHLLQGLIAQRENSTSRAIQEFETAVSFLSNQYRVFDDHALFYYPLALAYYESGDLEKAQLQFERTLDLTLGRLRGETFMPKAFTGWERFFRYRGRWKGPGTAMSNFCVFGRKRILILRKSEMPKNR